MSNSTLVKEFIAAADNNHWGARTKKISRIIVHHMAATWTAKRCAQSFQDPNRGASATYCIGLDGEIVQCLDETIAPGTSGSYAADNEAVTIEVANSTMGGNWPVSDAALASLIKLCADIAKRNKLGTLVKGKNLCWHQMYAATACPGPYLLGKMDYIVAEANKLNTPIVIKELAFRKLNGTNTQRLANYLVKYTKAGKTNTNQWGTEVRVDANGVVLDNPVYGQCNKTVPTGGCVLSGHDGASSWILNTIKKGYTVLFENGGVTVIPTGDGYVAGTNTQRLADQLIVYKAPKTSTGTNVWGTEVLCDASGKVIEKKAYGKGNSKIPSGGFVLSGHGKASTWLGSNIKVGTYVAVKNHKVYVI